MVRGSERENPVNVRAVSIFYGRTNGTTRENHNLRTRVVCVLCRNVGESLANDLDPEKRPFHTKYVSGKLFGQLKRGRIRAGERVLRPIYVR